MCLTCRYNKRYSVLANDADGIVVGKIPVKKGSVIEGKIEYNKQRMNVKQDNHRNIKNIRRGIPFTKNKPALKNKQFALSV